MRVDFRRSEHLTSGAAECWALVRDVTEVARCLPSVERLEAVGNGHYSACVSDKVGPFRVRVDVELVVVTSDLERRLEVTVRGGDAKTNTRVTGSLTVMVLDAEGGVALSVAAQAEVLGPLATLGAGPIRRRSDELFAGFLAGLVARLAQPA